MNKEQLLRGISEILKKHESFLNDNPDFFYAIEDRLFKALDDEYDSDNLEQYDDNDGYSDDGDYYDEDYGGGYGDDLFDRSPSDDEYSDEEDNDLGYEDEDEDAVSIDDDEDDEAAKWLREHQAQNNAPAQKPEKQAPQLAQQRPAERESYSRYINWSPSKSHYGEKHDEYEKYISEGYSPREAERFINEHKAPSDFYSALNYGVRPSEPSEKMLSHLKSIAKDWLVNAERKTEYEPEKNPIKYAANKSIQAHEQAYGDFEKEYNNFLNSDEIKGLKGRARHAAIQNFKTKWHEQNPEYRQKAISVADAGQHLKSAEEARAQRRQEGIEALLTARQSPGEAGEGYSAQAAGLGQSMTNQGIAQAVGGEENEDGGFQANIQSDPHALFAQKNPEFVSSLKQKLAQKLNPQQQQRMTAIDSFKKKGN